MKLNLPLYKIESIHQTHKDNPQRQLFHVIAEFLKGVEPRPTWRVIVDALRSPLVNLPQLAQKIEDAHFPKHDSSEPTASKTLYLFFLTISSPASTEPSDKTCHQ